MKKLKRFFVKLTATFACLSIVLPFGNVAFGFDNSECMPEIIEADEDGLNMGGEEVVKNFDYFDALFPGKRDGLTELCNLAGIDAKSYESSGGYEALKFVKLTQEKFFNRTNGKERWEMNNLNWVDDNSEKVKECLSKLGFFESVYPISDKYDIVAILGAGAPTMRKRIEFTEKLIKEKKLKEIKKIFLLTGARKVNRNIDDSPKGFLDEVSLNFGKEVDELTEKDLFVYLYKKSKLPEKLLCVIDSPEVNGKRPTTQTTVVDFIDKVKNYCSYAKNVLFISNQPYVKYQNAVIREIFYREDFNLEFETVGMGVDQKNIGNKQLNKFVSDVGAYIWAATPSILRNYEYKPGIITRWFLLKKCYGWTDLYRKNN